MAAPQLNEESLFKFALEFTSPEVREEFLQQACGPDLALLHRLRQLLRASDQHPEFLESPVIGTVVTHVTDDFHGGECVGDTIGNYKLLEEIGQGGFGTVYMAEQSAPIRRKVALKIPKAGMNTREVLARFDLERQALAMMDHPHIAKVFDGGATQSGRPYFVMELVRGVPITEYCDAVKLSLRQRLELFVDICRAVQHSHVKGIIHRDLKPSNVLVTMHDDRALVKVIDFGIAKALQQPFEGRSPFTGFQQLLGTPRYMSPEQSQMSGIDIDTRSDIYSLGVMLYELLTGTTPFTNESLPSAGFDDLRRIIQEQQPLRPSACVTTLEAQARSTIADRRRIDQRQIARELRGELDWIVMKALEKDRNRRYESAAEFTNDIQRFLNHQPVTAGPPSRLYRIRKGVWRYRWGLTAATIVIVSMVVATTISTVSAIRAGIALEQAQQSADRANTLLYATDVRFGAHALANGRVRQATELLARHLPLPGEPEKRGVEWFYLNQLARSQTRVLPLSEKPLYALALSPDRTQAAVAGADGQVRLLDLDSFAVMDQWDSRQVEVNHLAFTGRGDTLLSTGDNGTICFWDLKSKSPVRTIRFGEEKCYVALLDPSERFVIACGNAKDVRIFDVASGELVRSLETHQRTIEALALSPDTDLLAVASGDSTHSLWEWQTGKKITVSTPLPGRISAIQLPAHPKIVIEGSVDGALRFSTITSPAKRVARTLTDQIQSLQLSPSEQHLAIGCRDGTIHIVDTAFQLPLPKTINVLSGFQTSLGRVHSLQWLDDQNLLIVGESGQLLQSSFDRGRVGVRTLPSLAAHRVALAADGSELLFIDRERRSIFRYDFQREAAIHLPDFPSDHLWSDVIYGEAPSESIAVSGQGVLAIYSPNEPKLRYQQLPGSWEAPQLSLSANGRRLLVRCRPSDRILVLDYPALIPRVDLHKVDNEAAALSPRGDFVAFNAGRDLLVYDVSSRKVIATAANHHAESIRSITFDVAGDWIFTGGSDRRIQRWRWRTQAAPQAIGLEDTGVPDCLTTTSDGRTLISGSSHGQVTFWNIAMGQQLFPLLHSGFRFRQIGLSRDDRHVVAMDDRGEVSYLEILRDFPPEPMAP